VISSTAPEISPRALSDKNTTKVKKRKSKKKIQHDAFHESLSPIIDDSTRSIRTTSSSSMSEASSPSSRKKKTAKKTKKKKKQRSSSVETETTADMDESCASFKEDASNLLFHHHQDSLHMRSRLARSLSINEDSEGEEDLDGRPKEVPKQFAHSSLSDLGFHIEDDDDDDDDDDVEDIEDDDDDDEEKKKKDLPSIQEEDLTRSPSARHSRLRVARSNSRSRRPTSSSPARRRKDEEDSPGRRSNSTGPLHRRRNKNRNRNNNEPTALQSCIKGSRVKFLRHSKQKCKVYFHEIVNITPIIPCLELAGKRSELWFRQKDYDKILRQSMSIALKVKEGKKTRKCVRGLEHFLMVKTERYAAWNAVLVTQQVQRESNMWDDIRIHQAYLEASTTCRVVAQKRGQKDWETIQDYLWESL